VFLLRGVRAFIKCLSTRWYRGRTHRRKTVKPAICNRAGLSPPTVAGRSAITPFCGSIPGKRRASARGYVTMAWQTACLPTFSVSGVEPLKRRARAHGVAGKLSVFTLCVSLGRDASPWIRCSAPMVACPMAWQTSCLRPVSVDRFWVLCPQPRVGERALVVPSMWLHGKVCAGPTTSQMAYLYWNSAVQLHGNFSLFLRAG
jgi:hypothetical protein